MSASEIENSKEPLQQSRNSIWRRVECVLLFLVLPIVMAVWLPQGWLFPVLFVSMLAGAVLLHLTPGFHWRSLITGWHALRLLPILLFIAATALISWLVMREARPDALFMLIRERPHVMWVIAFFYPLLSALPQEILFRPLWFRRYGHLFPQGWTGILLNAAAFSFAHLMYWSWVVILMTFAGGIAFAWAYEVKKSFPLAVILHSVAGITLFAFGMGIYFYTGNVVRPF